MFNYRIVSSDKISNVVAFNPDSDNPIYQADSSHPNWQAIVEGLHNADPEVWELFDVAGGTVKRLRSLSDRVDYDGVNILFDGDPVHSVLADQILRFIKSGDSDKYDALIKFWEKVAQNPDQRSRDQLYDWLACHEFTITADGDIVGYKGVNVNERGYVSVSRGTAFVDGAEITGAIPNDVGSVVSMPRSAVDSDPNSACSTGLHVGDWSYASGFANTVLEVHVNPRDVVSIPSDSNFRKMRCCRYTVVARIEQEYKNTPVLKPEEKQYVGYSG